MTRIEFQQIIKNLLKPVDNTGQFHMENIRIACDLVYSNKMSHISDELVGDIDHWSKEYMNQDVTLDAGRNLYYSDLPATIVPIPGVTSGLRAINTSQGNALDFTPTTEMEMYYMDGSVTQMVDTTIGYWLQGQRIWYDESMTPAIANAGVRILLIPRFSEFDKDDVVSVPGCEDMAFVQEVIQFMAPSAPVNLKANNQ